MNFTAFDFETANASRSSACSIGLAIVRDSKIVETRHILIQPPSLHFDPFNIAIHGIRPSDVKNEPRFNTIWATIREYFENTLVIAHNASFDLSVLRATLDTYNIAYPQTAYTCTVQLSRKLWPAMPDHKLNSMAARLGFSFRHHNAEDDARICAEIALRACREAAVDNLDALATLFHMTHGQLLHNTYKPIKTIRKKTTKIH